MAEKVNSGQRKRFFALAIFLAVFFFGLVWAAVVPTGEAPDEAEHISMVNFLRQEKRLPVFDQEESLLKTTFTPQLWTSEFRTGAYYSQAYNSPLSYLPFLLLSGESSAESKSPMRVVSSLFIALFATLLFLSLANIEPKKIIPAATVTILVAFIPQVIFSAGYVNIEPVALCFSALSFYFLSLMLTGKSRLPIFLCFGLTLGLLALCKANYLILVIFFLLLTLVKIFVSENERKQKIYRAVMILVPILALNSWWWVRNIKLYDDPIIVNFISKKVAMGGPEWFLPPLIAGYNLFTIIWQPDFAKNTFLGFFAALGRLDIFLPTIFYVLFFLIVILLIFRALMPSDGKRNQLIVIAILFLFIVNLLIFSQKNLIDFSPQGRHLFLMLVPLAWILYLGAVEIKNRVAKISILIFPLLAAIWVILTVFLKYRAQGASLHENVGVFSIPAMAIYLLIIAASLVTILIKISQTKNE